MVHWQQINIEAPVAVAFLDRGLTTAANIITLGALAGLTSVMLVMLLGQTRVLYSMANDGLLPKKFFAGRSSQISYSLEEYNSGGSVRCNRGQCDSASTTSGRDGEHRHLAGLRDCVGHR